MKRVFFLMALGWAPSYGADPVSVGELPPAVVRGRRPGPIRQEEFKGQKLEKKRGDSALSHVLKRSGSVVVQEAGGEGSPPRFLVRGLDPIQNRYFLAGIPLTDAAYNADRWELFPFESIDRIQLFAEGVPASLLTDGLGGATVMELGALPCDKQRLVARFGSFGSLKTAAQACHESPLPTEWHVAYSRSREDFLFFDDGGAPFQPEAHALRRRSHNGFQRLALFPHVSLLQKERDKLQAFGLVVLTEKEVPGPTRAPAFGTFRHGMGWLGFRHSHQEVVPPASWEGSGFFRAEKGALQKAQDTALLFPGTTVGMAAGYRGSLRFPPLVALHAGGGYETLQVDTLGERVRAARLEIPSAVTLSVPWGKTEINPSLLSHYYRYDGAGGPKSYFLISPRLGVAHALGSYLRGRINVGHVYRAPSLVELYGAPQGLSSNAGLVAESAWKGSFGVDGEWRFEHSALETLRIAYTLSLSRASGLITYVQNSQQTRVAVNVGESRIVSQELESEADLALGLTARAALGLLHSLNLSDIAGQRGKTLPHRPSWQGALGVQYRWKRWTLGYDLTWRGPAHGDLINQSRLPAVAFQDARLSWEPAGWGAFTLELNNLGDVIQIPVTLEAFQVMEQNAGHWGYPAPGRRGYFTWRYDF